MKFKTLESNLEDIETIEIPKIDLDQYTTSSFMAASILHIAEFAYNDIKNKSVADLGCSSGMLCIGAALLGAKYCAGFDTDQSAIALSTKNAAHFNISGCDFILCDVNNINLSICSKKFDTVIMNPPFGPNGTDYSTFMKKALKMARKAIYLFHKPSARNSIFRFAKERGIYCKVIGEIKFNFDQSYKLHKADSFDVQLDLVRFSLKPIK